MCEHALKNDEQQLAELMSKFKVPVAANKDALPAEKSEVSK